MADVFISYHEKSAGELATQIADALEGVGISCWYAKRDMPPGGKFADYIPKEIRLCKLFLLILNEGSNHSEHVKNEINLAFRRIHKKEQMTLVPFKVDDCVLDDDVDYYVSRFHTVNGNPPDAQCIQKLIKKIAYILAGVVDNGSTSKRSRLLKYQYASLKFKRKYVLFKIKHVLFAIVALILLFALLFQSVTSYLRWWKLRSGTLQINCQGEMENYERLRYFPNNSNAPPWYGRRDKIFSIELSDCVTRIGNLAFAHCENLIDVKFSKHVTSIGMGSFGACKGLKEIEIPNSVTKIETAAFFRCKNLTRVSIPDSVTEIGKCAFAFCTNLSDVIIPDSVTSIGDRAFYGCKNLKVSVPKSLNTENAFPENTIMIRRE